MFRRRRREQADGPGFDSGAAQDDPDFFGDLDELDTGEGDDEEPAGPAGQPDQGSGPWDGAGDFPQQERMDFGSLLVPAYEGIRVEVEMAEGTGVCVTVLRGDSQEAQGPFGIELHARVHPAGEGTRHQQLEPIRFLGVDGPRWFLRGMIRGPAARRPELARPLEELFADVVVVRGDHPAPPGDLLEIRLPDDMRQALAEQFEQESAGQALPNPFERGPEITETR